MAACEECWSDAYMRSRILGISQVEAYQQLLREHDNITDPDDEFWTGCTDFCPPHCAADHRGEA